MEPEELTGSEPNDGYPVLLRDWIRADGLRCLKIKLRGNDARLGLRAHREDRPHVHRGRGDLAHRGFQLHGHRSRLRHGNSRPPAGRGGRAFTACCSTSSSRSLTTSRPTASMSAPSARASRCSSTKARTTGASCAWAGNWAGPGVALKTCKTLTGALLSLCWAKAHGMTLMVQDLTNPMFAQIPHVLLAAHAGTIIGVESNAMQFYPEASQTEARIHPGCIAGATVRSTRARCKGRALAIAWRKSAAGFPTRWRISRRDFGSARSFFNRSPRIRLLHSQSLVAGAVSLRHRDDDAHTALRGAACSSRSMASHGMVSPPITCRQSGSPRTPTPLTAMRSRT